MGRVSGCQGLQPLRSSRRLRAACLGVLRYIQTWQSLRGAWQMAANEEAAGAGRWGTWGAEGAGRGAVAGTSAAATRCAHSL